MKLEIPQELVEKAAKAFMQNDTLSEQSERGWRKALETASIEVDVLSDVELDFLLKESETSAAQEHRVYRSLCRTLKQVQGMREGNFDKKKYANVKLLAEAVRSFFQTREEPYVFMSDGSFQVPFLLEDASLEYSSESGHYLNLYLVGLSRGKKESRELQIYQHNVREAGGMTVVDALDYLSVLPFSQVLWTRYEKDLELYKSLWMGKCGKIAILRGVAKEVKHPTEQENRDKDRWWRNRETYKSDGGRLVLDDHLGWGSDSKKTSSKLYDKRGKSEDSETGEENEIKTFPIPNSMDILAFDLDRHIFIIVKAQNLSEYVFDKTLRSKIVLPEDDLKLVDVLVASVGQFSGDIVQGKVAGTNVLCSGEAGLGKTLTAEVLAEATNRCLYKVQCSQLGINPQELEFELKLVLDRAKRWNAILLLDEADVYMRRRGISIEQNAICGVFLRLMEYFDGILFATTNMGDDIDDAVESRCVAHIRYTMPNEAMSLRIWEVMSAQYALSLSSELKASLVSRFKISGRHIKKLTRLAKVMNSQLGSEINLELFDWVNRFQ